MNQQQAKMLKQLQQMQQKMAEAQEKLALETVEASAGGGMVTAAVNEALRGAQDLANRLMGQATEGMQMPNIPGMF